MRTDATAELVFVSVHMEKHGNVHRTLKRHKTPVNTDRNSSGATRMRLRGARELVCVFILSFVLLY